MTAPLAIGVGCRRDAPAAAVVALVRRARDLAGPERPARLFSLCDKRDEPGLRAAARLLGLDLLFLSREALAAAEGIVTPSAVARARFGVESVSEAAALAGAGRGARLLLPRIAADGVTCAVAVPREGVP